MNLPCGKKNADNQYVHGFPSYSHEDINLILSTKSLTHAPSGFKLK